MFCWRSSRIRWGGYSFQGQVLHKSTITLTTICECLSNGMPKSSDFWILQVWKGIFTIWWELYCGSIIFSWPGVRTNWAFKSLPSWVKFDSLVILVLWNKNASLFIEEVILLIWIDENVQVPGPGTFSASGYGKRNFPLREYAIFFIFFMGS